MAGSTLTHRLDLPAKLGRAGFGLIVTAFLALFALVALSVAAGDMLGFFSFLLPCTVFLLLLCMARPMSGAALVGDQRALLSASLVIWTFLLVSEAVFSHPGTTEQAVSGHFDKTAYYQAASWILSFFALAFITYFRPDYLRRLFSGPLKWSTIFAIIAAGSFVLSPVPSYSLALAFKLCVIVLTLHAIAATMTNQAEVRKLFSWLLLGTLIATVAGMASPFFAPGPAFEQGRLGWIPGLSGTAGILLLLSILFLLLDKNLWFLLLAGYSMVAMMLAGGKGGIVASFLSVMMFFMLLKRARQALAACAVFFVIFFLFVLFTPLGTYLQNYSQSNNAGTLTGRTNLWKAVWPDIEQQPIFGHGYRASRFVSAEVEGAFAEAGHIHNAFLEVLYNNGVVGLIPILVMSFYIVNNLVWIIRRPAPTRVRYYATASLALYIHLLLWGVTAPTFGGTPDNRFMTFFALLLVSIFLRAQSADNYQAFTYGDRNP